MFNLFGQPSRSAKELLAEVSTAAAEAVKAEELLADMVIAAAKNRAAAEAAAEARARAAAEAEAQARAKAAAEAAAEAEQTLWEHYPAEKALREELTNSEQTVNERIKLANDLLQLKTALNEQSKRVLTQIETLSRQETEVSRVDNEAKAKLERIRAFLLKDSKPTPQPEEFDIPNSMVL